ncbi:alpha/beta hydrolase [Clostridium sp.]|uniref:alpha/beta fold hydrolase n=1 Tax=Clostridium sp. TaxID=1506 RepID=UPI002FC83E7F
MDKMEHLVFQNLDCEVHYWFRKGSENKWVLFFHGAGVDHEMFQEQFQVFDSTYNLIAWDSRGHGMSKLDHGKKFHFKDMISDCMKLYEIYNIDKAIIVGQSMGGNLAQDIAYYYPKLVEKLVLIDCTRNTGKLTGLEKFSLKSSKFIFNCYPWKMLIKQSADACGNKDSVKSYVKSCFENIDKETFIDIMMEVIGCLHFDPEFMFKQPVLLLCGEDDKTGNIKKVATPWAKSDSNCKLYFIQNASHNSNQDNPEQVNQFMKDFLI